jgi:4-hydroxybenzoate polyprenyltransferase
MKLKYLAAYLAQRFPIVNMLLFAILFYTVLSCSQHFGINTFSFNPLDLLGGLACISFFFRLRVFDEIKDYELDCKLHPDRVLQSGKIRLIDLQIITGTLFLVEVYWSYVMGPNTLIMFGVCVGYSLIMRYEFFIPEYLKSRLLLYAISHMLIMPLVMIWLWSAWQPTLAFTAPLVILMSLSILGGFSFELARKIHAPDAERDEQDSYSKVLGLNGSIITVLIVLLVGVLAQFSLLDLIDASLWSFILISILYFFALFFYYRASKLKEQKLLRTAELIVSLFMLISYVSIIIETSIK